MSICLTNVLRLTSLRDIHKSMKNAVAYIRASTNEQHITLDAQESSIRQYAAAQGINLVSVVVDAGISAGIPLNNRAGGRQVLDLVKSKSVDMVIATKLDRIFRSAVDALSTTDFWAKKNVSAVFLDCGGQSVDTSSPLGKMFLTMMAGMAECERALIGERTKTALAHKKAQGKRASNHPPFGFRFEDGRMVEDESEQKIVAKVRQLKSMGWSCKKIADALNQKSVPARGIKWYSRSVWAM